MIAVFCSDTRPVSPRPRGIRGVPSGPPLTWNRGLLGLQADQRRGREPTLARGICGGLRQLGPCGIHRHPDRALVARGASGRPSTDAAEWPRPGSARCSPSGSRTDRDAVGPAAPLRGAPRRQPVDPPLRRTPPFRAITPRQRLPWPSPCSATTAARVADAGHGGRSLLRPGGGRYHYPSDVLGGAVLGALVALFVVRFPPTRRVADAIGDFAGIRLRPGHRRHPAPALVGRCEGDAVALT